MLANGDLISHMERESSFTKMEEDMSEVSKKESKKTSKHNIIGLMELCIKVLSKMESCMAWGNCIMKMEKEFTKVYFNKG